MRLMQKSPEVFLALDEIASIGQQDIHVLKAAVEKTPLGRVRINLHPGSDDSLHEMFIAIKRGSYIRPHKHPNKSEAFHVVSGAAKVIIFHDDGSIKQVVSLEAGVPNKPFYYRMSKPYFHTLMIESDLLIVHEITNGPFVPGGTLFADFAPDESDAEKIHAFQTMLQHVLSEEQSA